MKLRNFSIIFFLFMLFLSAISSADLNPAYSFANGCGRAWAIEEGFDKKPDIAIDKDGQTWVICNGKVYRATSSTLKELNYSEAGRKFPVQFVKSPKGQLYILWQSTNHKFITITSLLKGKIKRVASLQFHESYRYWNLFFYVDSLERFWITGEFPCIYFYEGGEWKHHKINRKKFFSQEWRNKKYVLANVSPEEWKNQDIVSCNFAPIRCTEASNGKMIFWARPGGIFLNFLLAFSNDKFEELQHTFSMPRDITRVSTVKAIANGVLLVAIDPWGKKTGPNVFEVDLEQQKVRPVLSLDPNLRVSEILADKRHAGAFLFVCDDIKSKKQSLWKVRKDKLVLEIGAKEGEWKVSYKKSPLLVSKKGHIWLAPGKSKIWIKSKGFNFLRKLGWRSSLLKKLDWCSGFPLTGINKIEEDRNGDIWFGSHYSNANGINGLCCLTPAGKKFKTWLKNSFASNWEKISFNTNQGAKFSFDKSGNLWAIMANGAVLARFDIDKKKWIRFSLGKDSRWPDIFYDNGGRIWLLEHSEKRVVVFENGKLNYFSSPRPACEFIINKSENCNVYPYGKHEIGINTFYISIKNGKACFVTNQQNFSVLNYFDGVSWKQWKTSDITSNSEEGTYFQSAPFFDEKGRLRINIEEKNWRWDGSNWKADTYLEGPFEKKKQLESLRDNRHRALREKLNKLENFSSDRIVNVFETNDGTMWAKSRFSFYKIVNDLWIEIDKGKHPLIGDIVFNSTIGVDKYKNLYIRTSKGLFVRSADPPTETMTVKKPAVTRFTAKVAPKITSKNLLAENLGILKSSDYKEREKAIKNLVRMGEKALPELKKLRAATKDDDLRWWIDVVIQQIEQNVISK